MKVRIITGVICAIIVIMLLAGTGLGFPGVMSIPMGVITAIAAYEIMRVSKCKNKVLTIVSMVFAAVAPAFVDFEMHKYIPVPTSVLIIGYVILLLLIMLKGYEKTKFEHVALALFASLIISEDKPKAPAIANAFDFPGIPIISLYVGFRVETSNSQLAFSTPSFSEVRNLCVDYPDLFQRSHCVFLILCAMYCAWMCDTWAYFVVSRFGKHKLSPKISPKKSVEGAIGGVVGSIVFCLATYFVCDRFFFVIDTVKWWMIALGAVVVSILGMCGDLSASVIKRNFGEKDFGNLFPGHGGVLDRVDSFLVTMPAMYVIIQIGLAIAGK